MNESLDPKVTWHEVYNDGTMVMTATEVGALCLVKVNEVGPIPVAGLRIKPQPGDADRARLVPR